MDREQINKIYSDYLNDCETEHDMEQIFDLALQAQADGDTVSREAVIEWLKGQDIIKTDWQEANARKQLRELPSVAIPSAEPINLRQVNLDCRYSYFDADDEKHEILYCCKDDCECDLKAIPSAEPKEGHWEWLTEDKYRCSNCNHETRVDECMNEPMYDFCPFCGAKMVEPQESEDKG